MTAAGNAFLPDIHMRQNVGQRKDVARPTRLVLVNGYWR